MFGLIWGALFGARAVGSGIKAMVDDEICKQQTRNEYRQTYYDRKGRERSLQNGKLVFTRFNREGEQILLDDKLNVIRNFTQEKRDQKYVEAKRNPNGKTVVLYKERYSSSLKDIKGHFYKDLNNGRLYVVREFPLWILGMAKYNEKGYNPTCRVYMDIETGEIVRKTDVELKFESQGKIGLSDDQFELFKQKVMEFKEKIKNIATDNYLNAYVGWE